ncbi:MAG: response regulator [Fimbriimonas sp.]|nr:response regulator [Fimbriimonas sp.]
MERHPKVLLVEGNGPAEKLARDAIAKAGIKCNLVVARDGVEACDLLFDGTQSPTLVLLALNLPKLSGFEVLTRIRSCDKTKRLTVVMLSASQEPVDIHRCFDLHANGYVHKDPDVECYETRLRLVLYYWIVVNQNANA